MTPHRLRHHPARTRALRTALAAGGLAALAAGTAVPAALAAPDRAGATLTTTITSAVVHPAKHSARFSFSVSGGSPTSAVAFRCDLWHHGYVVGPARACTSPKGYGSLQAGTYTFSVYAIDTTGTRSNTATHDFTIQ